jgi:hypothetical protein
MLRALACACVALAAIFRPGAHARAQEDACHGTGLELQDEVRLTPPDGAGAVALDAPVVVAYANDIDVDALAAALDPSDTCAGQLACLLEVGSGSAAPTVVPASIERLDAHTVVLRPTRSLPADSELALLYARPGFDRPTRGQASFETGDDLDREPPTLSASAADLDLRVEPPPEPCGAPAGTLRVRLSVPTPEDDGDPSSVEVLAYLSRSEARADAGSDLQAPSLRARARPEDGDEDALTLTLFLTPEEARGRICVALRAVDGVGRSAERSPEACFDPGAAERSLFASSCAARLPGSGSAGGRDGLPGALLLWAAVALGRRRASDTVGNPTHRRSGAGA